MAQKSLSKRARDNRANQLNPAHPVYHRSRGVSAEQAESLAAHAQPAVNNRANQLNPNSDAYRQSRGLSERSASSSNASSTKSE